MKMPRTHLCSQEFVFVIGRYRHAEWDCNCILFIFENDYSRCHVKKVNIIEVITHKNVLNMPYPESPYHPRQVTKTKGKL